MKKTCKNRVYGFLKFSGGRIVEHYLKWIQVDGLVPPNTKKELFFKSIRLAPCSLRYHSTTITNSTTAKSRPERE